MNHLKPHLRGFFLAILFTLFLCNYNTAAQSSLFNTPTTDVMPAGETYVEADFDAHLDAYRNGGFQSYGVSVLHGIGKRAEIGFNVYYTRTGEPDQPVELQPNLKLQVYNSEEKGISVAVGTVLYIPVTNPSGADTFGSVYATVSKKIPGSFGPRFTGGAYALVGRDKDSGNRKGFLVGYEQPLHSRVSFIADWNTGKNRFGYSAAGLGITLTKRSFLYTGYYFGNEGRGNNSLGIYYGFTF
jgi:hypothetical protein